MPGLGTSDSDFVVRHFITDIGLISSDSIIKSNAEHYSFTDGSFTDWPRCVISIVDVSALLDWSIGMASRAVHLIHLPYSFICPYDMIKLKLLLLVIVES
jgi:hypothetical protein